MLERDYLRGRSVALSISESADLGMMGLSAVHLADAFVELARHLLADGASLTYGGDLRQGGYTELLFELIERYRPDATSERPVFTNMLPWPVHMNLPADELSRLRSSLPRSTAVVCLSREGEVIRKGGDSGFEPRAPKLADWSRGLSAMRARTARLSDVRIVLGGRTDGYKGDMPGIAEEAKLTLQLRKPLFVIGGFGGCAADICRAAGLWHERRVNVWQGRDYFEVGEFDLRNGLDRDENGILARTPHIDEAIALILRGVTRLFR